MGSDLRKQVTRRRCHHASTHAIAAAPSPTTLVQLARYKPGDAYHGTRTSSITRFLEAASGGLREFGGRKERFLKYDGVELTFLLAHRTKESGTLETIRYWLTYFMATREVEIKEEKGQRIYATSLTLLRRSRLPKTVMAHDDRGRSMDTPDIEADYYHEDDLLVGNTISVFGRDMLICDCYDSTAEWYAENYGIDQKEHAVDLTVPPPPPVVHPVPPHNGFGGEEDTLNSLKSLIPKAPKLDVRTLTGVRKRWKARMVTTDPVDRGRDFRITFYADPKEVTILEPPIRNSGVIGGLFLRRIKLRNPATKEYYKMADFTVGAEIVVNAHTFYIYDTEMLTGPGL